MDRKNKLIPIIPVSGEGYSRFDAVPHLFADLAQINLLLTNKCNLKCGYCYEQHKHDYGKFTPESLKHAYDWFNKINTKPKKSFQFFGGEPLLHKKLIKEFIETYNDELNSNYKNYSGTYISMCTNGLLIDDEFIEFYFGKPYTHMLVSVDTFDASIDIRDTSPEQLEKLAQTIEKITKRLGSEPQRLVIRSTLSEETAKEMGAFINRLYSAGVRNIIVHPLVLDSGRGYIKWSDENWENMRRDVFDALHKYPDLIIKFSEGVGLKGENNCMVGSDMIAIDGSGDFSGCYFFTNMKGNSGVDSTVLGNIFQDKIYVSRYKRFQAEYNKMFETHDQCKTCDLQNFCYQCPAGNLSTSDLKTMFRPDDMCQQIVKLFLDFQNDIYNKMFFRDVNIHLSRYQMNGQQYINNVLNDFGLDPNVDVYDHYLKISEQKNIKPETLSESDFSKCFYLQTLILLLS